MRAGVRPAMLEGQSDPDLDPRGRHEATLVAGRLQDEGIAAIYTSTLRRTAQTAAPLAEQTGLTPRVDADLREVFLGEWEGGTFRQRVSERHPLAVRCFEEQRWDPIPGSEPYDALRERVGLVIGRIADAHPDERVAVFTHGGIIGMILHLATGAGPFAFIAADNGSLTHLVVAPDRWIVRRFNDTGHLYTDLDRPVQPLPDTVVARRGVVLPLRGGRPRPLGGG
jgi:probable phosphoglycerate mutase